MNARLFFDTNVLVYAVVRDDPRAAVAESLLAEGGIISVQVLNEFTAVARRKLGMSWDEVTAASTAFRALCAQPVAVTVNTHERALALAVRHGFGIYDALIVAAALEAQCHTLYSEDLQAGRVFDGQLVIRNPFDGA